MSRKKRPINTADSERSFTLFFFLFPSLSPSPVLLLYYSHDFFLPSFLPFILSSVLCHDPLLLFQPRFTHQHGCVLERVAGFLGKTVVRSAPRPAARSPAARLLCN